MGYEGFFISNLKVFPGTEFFFACIRTRIKVRSGSGSVTNFFRSWIQIRIKMIRIRHTACLERFLCHYLHRHIHKPSWIPRLLIQPLQHDRFRNQSKNIFRLSVSYYVIYTTPHGKDWKPSPCKIFFALMCKWNWQITKFRVLKHELMMTSLCRDMRSPLPEPLSHGDDPVRHGFDGVTPLLQNQQLKRRGKTYAHCAIARDTTRGKIDYQFIERTRNVQIETDFAKYPATQKNGHQIPDPIWPINLKPYRYRNTNVEFCSFFYSS